MQENLHNKVWTPDLEEIGQERRFIFEQLESIGIEKISELVGTAVAYRQNAYRPYSKYSVGAAIITDQGDIYGGSNSEFVTYSPTNHAEGVAITLANNEGEGNRNRKFIKALAVCHEGSSGPCGECLQRTVEHADNCLVIIVDPQGEVRRVTSLKTLLPYNFNPSHLGIE